jgi:hypothetical protein
MIAINKSFREPFSVVRAGFFDGDLSERLRRYCGDFKKLNTPRGEKHVLYDPDEPSLVFVSRLARIKIHNSERINLYVGFTSYFENTNMKMLEEFRRKTELSLGECENIYLRQIERELMPYIFQEINTKGLSVLESKFLG